MRVRLLIHFHFVSFVEGKERTRARLELFANARDASEEDWIEYVHTRDGLTDVYEIGARSFVLQKS